MDKHKVCRCCSKVVSVCIYLNNYKSTAARGGGGGAVQQGGGQAQPAYQQPFDTFQRHEVNELMGLARTLGQTVKEVKTHTSDIYTRVYQLESKLNSMGGQQQGQGAIKTIMTFYRTLSHRRWQCASSRWS